MTFVDVYTFMLLCCSGPIKCSILHLEKSAGNVHVQWKGLLFPNCRARGYAAARNFPESIYTPSWLWKRCRGVRRLWVWGWILQRSARLHTLKTASAWLRLLSVVVFGSVWERVSLRQRDLNFWCYQVIFLGTPAPSPCRYRVQFSSRQHSDRSVRPWCLVAASVSSRTQEWESKQIFLLCY